MTVRYLPFCRLSEPHDDPRHRREGCECPCHGTDNPWWSPPRDRSQQLPHKHGGVS